MSMKVLIVDPDWRFAQQADRYLEEHAHLVVRFGSAEDAVTHASHWQPDLVILAAELVDDELISRFENTSSPRPAVLITEHMDRFDRAWKAWQTGGDELLMKPVFRAEELHQAIVTAMENATAGTRQRPAAAIA